MTLTTQQWLIVKAFIKERVKAGDSVAAACEQASAQLLTETVPNLSGAPIEISGMRLQTLYSRRKR